MITLSQRLISIIFYLFPSTDIIQYGNAVYTNFPLAKVVFYAIRPIIYLQNNIVLSDLLIFAILFLGIARNAKISYFIRFNAMQVILLKFILILIRYIYILILQLNIPYFLEESIETTIFIGMVTLIIFSIIQSLRGIEADLPFISQAAKMQI